MDASCGEILRLGREGHSTPTMRSEEEAEAEEEEEEEEE